MGQGQKPVSTQVMDTVTKQRPVTTMTTESRQVPVTNYVTENITKQRPVVSTVMDAVQRPVTSTVMDTVQRPVTSTVMDTVAKQVHGVVTEQHHATVRTTQQVHQSQQMIPGPVTQSGPVTTGSNYVGTVGTGAIGGYGGVVS